MFAGKSRRYFNRFLILQGNTEINKKKRKYVSFPMTNSMSWKKSHSRYRLRRSRSFLKRGDVALLTRGDPGIYAAIYCTKA